MALLPKDYHAFVNMYHTNTENGVQEKIIREMSTQTGELRILIAAIAYGMGVDSSTVHSTIFGGGPGTMHICYKENIRDLFGKGQHPGFKVIGL